jgi:CheY-like chemotaxis protein
MTKNAAAPLTLRRLDGSPVRVLVVHDESNLTELLSMALRYEGWEVPSTASSLAAVRAAKEFEPDAVALDMMLSDFDGLEVLRGLRAHNPTLPILFLTARDAVEDGVAPKPVALALAEAIREVGHRPAPRLRPGLVCDVDLLTEPERRDKVAPGSAFHRE